jgi:putative transposase
MRRVSLANGEIYHVYNRGVDKRKVFLNTRDYQRFVDGLIIFNTKERIASHSFGTKKSFKDENALVNIMAYCLMPNHFHLLLEQRTENGIAKYIQKLITGYTMYFNKKHDRSGVLYQGVFKSKHVKTNAYLLELSRYIHANPTEILGENAKGRVDVRNYLLKYPWSSLSDYADSKGHSDLSALNKEMILGQFSSPSNYVDFVLRIFPRRNLGRVNTPAGNFLGSSEVSPRKQIGKF